MADQKASDQIAAYYTNLSEKIGDHALVRDIVFDAARKLHSGELELKSPEASNG